MNWHYIAKLIFNFTNYKFESKLMQSIPQKWDAEDYAKNSSAQSQWGQELISKLTLQGNETVLDIGCGDGKISAQLAQIVKNGTVVGIDLSEDMVRLAKENFPSDKYPNLSFMCMDAANIHLPDKFDIAFSNATLHWVKDHVAVLYGLRACLKEGGKVLLQMGGIGNAADIFSIVKMVTQYPRWEQYYREFETPYYFYGPEEYEDWLINSSFRAIRIELVFKDMQHQGVEGLSGWLRTTWFPYTDPLPTELRDTFWADVVAAYTTAHPIDLLGNTHVVMVRLEVEARAI